LIEKIFGSNKFETKSEKGIGLGFYISRKIIEDHGGRIWAENNKDGEKDQYFHLVFQFRELQYIFGMQLADSNVPIKRTILLLLLLYALLLLAQFCI
jgi:signal transduction histidine kinase